MKTVFSGIQPSGELHLGNYLGAIRNWVAYQETHFCYFCIVDYHAITQSYTRAEMQSRVMAMAVDLLACGVDPERSVLFVQSHVPEHTELCWVLNAVAPFGDLSRMTQFKDKSTKQEEHVNVGLFDYPVLQSADILLYKAQAVPIGQDQVQHLEFARRIARGFNRRWGKTFPEPEPLLSSTPKIIGLEGKAKMSKSLGNTISLRATNQQIRRSLARATTDLARVTRQDPGDPQRCNIFSLHKFFSDEAKQKWVINGCTSAGIGCVECKSVLGDNLITHFEPIRRRCQELVAHPQKVIDTLAQGAVRARAVASKNMAAVRKKLGLFPLVPPIQ